MVARAGACAPGGSRARRGCGECARCCGLAASRRSQVCVWAGRDGGALAISARNCCGGESGRRASGPHSAASLGLPLPLAPVLLPVGFIGDWPSGAAQCLKKTFMSTDGNSRSIPGQGTCTLLTGNRPSTPKFSGIWSRKQPMVIQGQNSRFSLVFSSSVCDCHRFRTATSSSVRNS